MKNLKNQIGVSVTAALAACLCMPAFAGGVFSTDRFGYTGVVTRYSTLADALAKAPGTATDVVNIGEVPANNSFEHRDASFYVVDDASAYDTNYNILTGSWWYTISSNGAGWGNINGNTGVGFMQLYDDDGSTDTSVNMGFSNFSGGYWTDYTLQVTGANAAAADYARFSAYNNNYDAGAYLSYDLNITATGLLGVQTGDVIEANNHATGVSGTFNALFQLSDSSPAGPNAGASDGFYTIELIFDMENWAFANNGALMGPYQDGGNIYDSLFVETGVPVVPVPGAAGLGLLGMGLVGYMRRRKNVVA